MKRYGNFVALFALCTLAAKDNQLSASEKQFMMKAAAGGLAEVELGKLAIEHASDSAVKQFGQRMLDDHTKANDDLKQVASKKGISLPAEPGSKEKALIASLSERKGAEFDKRYMDHMVKDHKEDVKEFQREAGHAR